MSGNNTLGTFWPPRGWDKLSFIKEMSAQALYKDPVHATITGLNYNIEPIPVYLKNKQRSYIYKVCIDGWNYSIHNESHEFNVLSFQMAERSNQSLSRDNFISNIRVKSRPFLLNNRSAERAYLAASLMIRQIRNGQVPDYERILKLHKIHPTQRRLYAQDFHRENSLNCGLAAISYEADRASVL